MCTIDKWSMVRSYVEVVVASLDGEHGEEHGDLVSGRSDNSHDTVGAIRVSAWPAWTYNTSACRRQQVVTRYTPHPAQIFIRYSTTTPMLLSVFVQSAYFSIITPD